ncbi:hypothetical protein ACH5RR_038412 [Cinchona calisaya]|uniref:Histone deacetylase complex subunit SAP30 Sin3 binding domain-containing protein n=1 Tax=Cinchona calisaya TaxID=153742 RepID=A0ABD2XV81_9GENT
MLENELFSSRILSPFREESGDEELSVLPRHTKVIVTGNNRTKSVLVGLQGVVKKAVGLGGWHWLVLKNGVEVKLQRNALSVLEPPTGNEEDDDYGFDDSSSDLDENHHFPTGIEFSKLSKARIRYARPWIPSVSSKSINHKSGRKVQFNNHAPQQHRGMNMAKLGTGSLWRYCQSFKLASIKTTPTKEQLVNIVQQHFTSQRVDEVQVVVEFVRAAKRLRAVDAH